MALEKLKKTSEMKIKVKILQLDHIYVYLMMSPSSRAFLLNLAPLALAFDYKGFSVFLLTGVTFVPQNKVEILTSVH